jgi:hypothetical protein
MKAAVVELVEHFCRKQNDFGLQSRQNLYRNCRRGKPRFSGWTFILSGKKFSCFSEIDKDCNIHQRRQVEITFEYRFLS